MEPKDLKNSEELKSTAQSGTDKPEETVDSKNAETTDSKEVNQENEKTIASVEKPQEDTEAETSEVEKVKNSVEEEVDNESTADEEPEAIAESTEEIADQEKEKPADDDAEKPIPESEPEEKIEASEEVAEEKPVEEEEKPQTKVEAKEKEEAKAKEKVEEEPEPLTVDEKKEAVVEPADKKEQKYREKKEPNDYSKYTQVELINELRNVLENYDDVNDLRSEIDAIKSVFYKIRNENIEEAKKEFVKGGGAEEEFVEEPDPYENDLRDLLRKYKQIRIGLNKQQEHDKEANLKRKYEVIEQIKGLINNEESINKTFNEFRELQNEWREIGLVPQSKMKNLWDLYHFHVENFYDYIKINRELRDLDLKKNLEIKIQLCEHAEELLVEPSAIKAFNTLQKYHEQWREIGPVPRENKDDIWERFKTVTAKINKKHQEFFESRKTDQKKNLEAKIALCEKVEEINTEELENFKDWDEKSRELIELQKIWRTIGFAPKKDNNRIYERFRTACDDFFNKKREFYSKSKELQQNNLQLKIDLCVQAEALKDSTDWKKTTQDLINIQKQWKEIGPLPRKHSDTVWKRFRSACDYFFEKKSEHFSDVDSEQVDNLKLKEDLITEVTNFKSKGNVNENLKSLKDFQRRWTEIGHVPFKKKDELQNRFREAINILFDELNIDEDKRNLLKFKSKMVSFSESGRGQSKMRMERDKYMNKLKQLENDLVLLDNNVGFFAKSKNAEALIADVENKIEMTKQKIETLKEKIRVIDDLDN